MFNPIISTNSMVKGQSHSFILVPINISYTTAYLTFALGRTVQPQYFTLQTDGRQSY